MPWPKSGTTHYNAQIEKLQDKDYAIKRVGCLYKFGMNNDMKSINSGIEYRLLIYYCPPPSCYNYFFNPISCK